MRRAIHGQLSPDVRTLDRLIDAGACADAALLIFRTLLPDCGFKLVMPPPVSGGAAQPAFASDWRRGDAQTLSQRAETPSLALFRAAQYELMKLRNSEALARCARCRGVGWFVTVSGKLEICSDPEHARHRY